MIRLALILALLAFSISTAFAGASTAGSSAGAATSGAGSSASSETTSPDDDDKLVLQARDDAASFVATDGRIRGAQLEAALKHLRERNLAAKRASDMQLAQAILAL